VRRPPPGWLSDITRKFDPAASTEVSARRRPKRYESSSTMQNDEETMVKQRRRFKQTTTLAQRLTQEARRLRERARLLPPGAEQIQLLRKVRQAEAALRIDAWLASPTNHPPSEVMTLTSKSHKRRCANISRGPDS
jgi:hypothetical protein